MIYLGFYLRRGTECEQPAAVVMSKNRWRCRAYIYWEHRCSLQKEPRFYKEQMSKLLTPSALKNKCSTKIVHSERLGRHYPKI